MLAALGIALGLLLLIIPGIFLVVRWFFVPQAVVLEDAPRPGALTASGRMVEGFWWRACGIVVLANLAATLPNMLLVTPFAAIGESADRAVWGLIGRDRGRVGDRAVRGAPVDAALLRPAGAKAQCGYRPAVLPRHDELLGQRGARLR